MNTLEELKYYCNQKNPSGALLLTGEWGCGKTFLIEHLLKDSLSESHVIIRISLFGLTDISQLHQNVNKAWLQAKSGLCSKIDEKKKIASTINNALGSIVPLKKYTSVAGSVLSLNISDLISIENTIDKKPVILVFDDLERSKLDQIDMLGAINHYSENKGFKVIVIANEEFMQKTSDDKSSGISYSEIKEKLIQRTIHHTPDYAAIVKNIISDYASETPAYSDFLQKCLPSLQALFSDTMPNGDSLTDVSSEKIKEVQMYSHQDKDAYVNEKTELLRKKQHNIRSLKCAIQDFERIFDKLNSYNISHVDTYFFSFVSCMLASKAGLYAPTDRYGSIFASSNLEFLYPGYYKATFLPGCFETWITMGVWNEKEIDEYCEKTAMLQSHSDIPQDLVRLQRIDYLEEDEVTQGFPEVLTMAYDGELTLDEYVTFILNLSIARQYDFALPCEISWNQLNIGIKNKLQSILESGDLDYHTTTRLDVSMLSEPEKESYLLIESFIKSEKSMFLINEKAFINAMSAYYETAFIECSKKRFDSFTDAMATASVKAFEEADNYGKACFVGYMTDFLEKLSNSYDYKNNDSESKGDGITSLKNQLTELRDKKYADKAFAKKNTDILINELDKYMPNVSLP